MEHLILSFELRKIVLHPLQINLFMNLIGRVDTILQVDYLVRSIRLHVCIVAGKGIHHQNALVFLITSFGRPFSLEISGVSYECLDTGHIAKNCKSTYLCRKCKTGKHHASICESASVDPPGMNREEDKNITTNVTTNDNEGFLCLIAATKMVYYCRQLEPAYF